MIRQCIGKAEAAAIMAAESEEYGAGFLKCCRARETPLTGSSTLTPSHSVCSGNIVPSTEKEMQTQKGQASKQEAKPANRKSRHLLVPSRTLWAPEHLHLI